MNRVIYLLLTLALTAAPLAAQTGARPKDAPKAPAAAPGRELKNAAPPAAAEPAGAPAVAEECGCEDARLPEVLAVVNGVKITRADLSPQTRERVAELQRRVVEARRRELELQINSLLLEAESKKRGAPVTKILEEEVVAKAPEPTEAEALAFFNQNKARIAEQAGGAVEFKQVRDAVVTHLRAERRQEFAKKFSERLRAAADVKVLTQRPTPPASPAERARLFATVDGRSVTSGDVEDNLRAMIYGVQEEVYGLRHRDLEMRINDILLAQAAQSKQVTARALLDAEVGARMKPVTEAEALEFYKQNKDKIEGDFAQLKDKIVRHLQDAEGRAVLVAFAKNLRRGAAVETFLNAPEPPVYALATDDQPAKGGPESAAVTVVEFTDFQCPSCARIQPVLDRLVAEYGGRVRLVARDYPLPQHADAFRAAEAAEAAREQGKYWLYAAKLFANQSALGVDRLKQYATELGLDRARFDAALDGGKFSGHVRRDVEDGQRVGVDATPSLFVNGRRVNERSYEGLKAAIEAALGGAEGK